MTGERGDARKRNLAVVPCCDAAEKVARVRAVIDACAAGCADVRWLKDHLRAALDGPAGGGVS